MKMNRKSLVLSFAVALLAMLPAAAQTVNYKFQTVDFTGDQFTQLLGINNHGIIAGYHGFAVNQGFTYDLATGVFTSENFPGSQQTQVIGINENNNKTVGFYITGGVTHGFLDSAGKFSKVDLPGTPFNQLLGQNDAGQAAGYYSTKADGSGPDHAYIYNEFGATFEVFTIPGSTSAQATGINDSGVVCGFYVDAKGVNHGWMQNLGQFTPLNYPHSTGTQALGLNNKGQVVGSYTDSTGGSHGFLYEVATKTWQSIDDPNNGAGTTIVNGIADNGNIVGFSGTAPINNGFVGVVQ
jgi:probable HAF family extracellular repeat protein